MTEASSNEHTVPTLKDAGAAALQFGGIPALIQFFRRNAASTRSAHELKATMQVLAGIVSASMEERDEIATLIHSELEASAVNQNLLREHHDSEKEQIASHYKAEADSLEEQNVGVFELCRIVQRREKLQLQKSFLENLNQQLADILERVEHRSESHE